MGKSFKKRFKKLVRKTPQYKLIKGAKDALNPDMGDLGEDPRSEAAQQLIKQDVSRQAGGAQINFTEEKLV